MQIRISGKKIDVGDALRAHVEKRLSDGVGKYFDRPADANVVFSRDGHGFRCDASVHLPAGLTAKAQGSSAEIYDAFERSAERIEKQTRRYHRRLKNHHSDNAKRTEAFSAPPQILEAPEDDNGGTVKADRDKS